MEITLELVERLREKADVTYAQAKQALEYSQGNLLDALIYLEEQGEIPRPQQAYYSTQGAAQPAPPAGELVVPAASESGGREEKERRHLMKRLFTALRRALVENELEIWRRQEPVTSVPVLILIILVLFAFWVTIPLLIFGLFLGFRYRFSGPDLERESINDMIEKVASTADDVGQQVMDELRIQHEKHTKDRER